MCGISGFIGKGFREIVPLINAAQRHRGHDDEGYFWEDNVQLGFGHKRLSIIDVADGHQHFCNEDESIVLVYNGEIFNAGPLRTQLEQAGHQFKTDHSDTEVILRLYEAHGIEMTRLLNGMFSFALYDKKKGKVFGARDRFGIKPFYYTTAGGCFAFSSEVKALLAIPFLPREINRKVITHYLSFQCIPAPWSIFEGILKLPAAHYVEMDVDSHSLTVKKYCNLSFQSRTYDMQQLLERTWKAVEEAVHRWSISDVELGCSLSGGLDSSIVTMLASKNVNLKTFTLVFQGFEDIDERNSARLLANTCGTDHHEIIVREGDIARELPFMLRSLDEPYGGGLPSWFVYREMSESMKVCMTGTAGDELLGSH